MPYIMIGTSTQMVTGSMRKPFMIFLSLAFVAMIAIPDAEAAKRVALVIGNSAYEHTRKLPNPKNDAKAIAATLKRIGFDQVTLRLDLGYRPMRDAIRAFGRDAKDADVALVYYAGHGLELGRQNFLVPIDAKLRTDDDLPYEAVTLDETLRAVRRAKNLRLVILDACRNNPLASTMELAAGITRSVSRGFSRIEPTGDVLVAYSAKHGTVAEDGDDEHSPFAKALLKHLPTPGLDVGFMFRRVRTAVLEATSRRQEPFTYGSLGRENVFLVPPSEKSSVKVPLGPAAQAWEAVKDSKSSSDLEAFIYSYPDSFFAKLAKTRLSAITNRLERARRLQQKTKEAAAGTHSSVRRGCQMLASFRSIHEAKLHQSKDQTVKHITGNSEIFHSVDEKNGFTLMQQINLKIDFGGKKSVNFFSRGRFIESIDGSQIDFATDSEQGDGGKEFASGTAKISADAGLIQLKLEKPQFENFELPGTVLFPTQLGPALVNAAKQGKKKTSLSLYEGLGNGKELSSVSAIIGESFGLLNWDTVNHTKATKFLSDLVGLESWPIEVEYHAIQKNGEKKSIFTTKLRLFENGVGVDYIYDFEDFSIALSPVSLSIHDRRM